LLVDFTMKIIFITIFLSLAFLNLQSQNVTGIWRGHFWSNDLRSKNSIQQPFQGDDRYKIEVQIAQDGNSFKGVTYSYLSTIFYAKADADGTVNDKTKKVLLRELKLLEVRSLGGDIYSMTYFLHYSKLGDEEFLEGTYTSMNMHDSTRGTSGVVFLHKVPESDFYKEQFVEKRQEEIAKNKSAMEGLEKSGKTVVHAREKPKPNIINAPTRKDTVSGKRPSNMRPKVASIHSQHQGSTPKAPQKSDIASNIAPVVVDSVNRERKISVPVIIPKVLSSRQNQLVKTITVNTKEIELDIYDDGTIDNDTVSVYLDKKLVISHAMLTDRAIVMKVHMDEDNDYHEVVMVADNEGTIPPNTSLMIVKAGEKRYEVRIISTEQKNATVIFKYEKP